MILIKKVFTLSLRIFLIATLIVQSFAPLVNNIAYAAGSLNLLTSIDVYPTTANNGDQFIYEVYMRNNGPDSGNGTQFLSQLATGVTNLAVSCSLTGNGALCPTLFTGMNTVSGTISTFPNNGEIRITITGRFPVMSPTSVSHIATIIPPLGTLETDPSNNTSIINTTIMKLPADVASVISGGTTPWEYNTPVTYDITHINNGSGIADGGRIGFYIYNTVLPRYSTLSINITGVSISCVGSGGAVCPNLTGLVLPTFIRGLHTNDSRSYNDAFYRLLQVGFWPNGGSLKFTVTFTPISNTNPSCEIGGALITPNIRANSYSIPPPGISDPNGSNDDDIQLTSSEDVLIDACPIVDVASVISGGTTPWEYNTPVTYDITHINNGSGIADGGRIGFYIYNTVLPQYSTLSINITGVSISCVGSGGAVCPNLTGLVLPTFIRGLHTNDSRSYNDAFYRLLQVGFWPNGGSLKFTVTFTPISNTNPSCEIGGALITPNIRANSYSIPPPGISDPNGSNDDDIQLTSSEDVLIDACPIVDVASVISGGTTPWEYNTPVTYDITHINNGSGIADGGRIGFYIYNTVLPQYSTLSINITGVSISCVGSGGAVCPNLTGLVLPTFIRGLHTNDSRSYNDAFYRLLQVGFWPNGGSLKFTVTFTPISNSCTVSGITPNIRANSYSIPPPGISDPNGSNDDDIAITDISTNSCIDLTSSIDINPLYAYVNTPMQIVMNYRSGLGTASGSLITGYLSSGFIYDSWSCVSSGGALCGYLVYDAITQTFTGTVPYLPNGGQVSYYFSGWATSYSSTWETTTTITPGSGGYDSNLSTNFSQLNFSVIDDNPFILKRSIDKTVTPGGQVRYMLDVINPISGLNLSTGMLTDTLPTGFTYNSTVSIGLSGTATRIPLIDPVIGTSSPTRGEFYLYAGDSIHVEFLVDVASLLPNGTGVYQNSSFFTYSTEFSGYNSIHYDGDLTGVINDDVIVDIPSPVIIDANNDSALFTGGTTGVVSILNNDTLSGGQATIGNVVVLFSGSTLFTGLIYDNTGGQIVVGPTALTGIYIIPYQICEIVNPSNCDTATVIITIVEPPIIPIIATDDSALFTGGIGGVISILTNDTLSGNQATTGNVTVLFTGVGPSFSFTGAQYFTGLIYDNTGGQVIVGPTALTGIYIIPYYICELNYDSHGNQLTNLKNCDPATIMITIVSPLIVVPPIVPPIITPPSGGGGGGYAGCGTGCYIPPQPETIHPAPPIKKQVKLTPVIEDIPLIPKTGPAKIIDGLQEIGKNVYNTLFISPTSVNHIPKNMDQWIQDRLGDHTQKSIGYFIVPKYSIIIPLLKQEVDGGYMITKESYYMIQMMLMSISEDDSVWLYNWEDSDKTFALKEYNYDSDVKERLSLSYKDYTTTIGIKK